MSDPPSPVSDQIGSNISIFIENNAMASPRHEIASPSHGMASLSHDSQFSGSGRVNLSLSSEESWREPCSDEVIELQNRVEKKDERIADLLNIIDELEAQVESRPMLDGSFAAQERASEKRASKKRLTRRSIIEKHRASAVADTSTELECLERDLDEALLQNKELTLTLLELTEKEKELRALLTEEMNNFESKDNECEMLRLEIEKLRPELKRKDKTIAVLNNQVDVLEEELNKLGHLAEQFTNSASCMSPGYKSFADLHSDGHLSPGIASKDLDDERSRWAKQVHELTSLVEAQKEAMRVSALKVTAMWRNNLRLTQVEPEAKQPEPVMRSRPRRKTISEGQAPPINEDGVPMALPPVSPLTVNATTSDSPRSVPDGQNMALSPVEQSAENAFEPDEVNTTMLTSASQVAASSTLESSVEVAALSSAGGSSSLRSLGTPTLIEKPALAPLARTVPQKYSSWSTGIMDHQMRGKMSSAVDASRSKVRSVGLSSMYRPDFHRSKLSHMLCTKKLPTVEELRAHVMETKRKMSERQNGAKFKREGSPQAEVDLDKLLNDRLAMRRDYEQGLPERASAPSQTQEVTSFKNVVKPEPVVVEKSDSAVVEKPEPLAVEETVQQESKKTRNRMVKMKIRVDTVCQICKNNFQASGFPSPHLQPPSQSAIRQPRIIRSTANQRNPRPLFNIPIANPPKAIVNAGDITPVQ